MINEFLWLQLEDMDVNDVDFQQDGSPCYSLNLNQSKSTDYQ